MKEKPTSPAAQGGASAPEALSVLDLAHGRLKLPAFLPDATHGFVRSLDSADLESCAVSALVMNTFCLLQKPGIGVISRAGGLHAFSSWERPIATDSGGFQSFSIIRQNPKSGSISKKGLIFRPQGAGEKMLLTPEKVIQRQMAFGADIMFCLDFCTHIDDDPSVQETAVKRTVEWAKRSRREFDKLWCAKKEGDRRRPMLFAVVQGGGSFDLRKRCAEELLSIGFDGFGFGGWPLDSKGALIKEVLACVRELIPTSFPLHALGVGHPANVLHCAAMNYALFDSAMPTKDARHGRLYVRQRPACVSDAHWFDYLYIEDKKLTRLTQPISPHCDQLCCRRYTQAFLHHLFLNKDPLYLRLATLHNLRFMQLLMESLQRAA